ncbi:MAG: AraC family transcriptional regulator [Chitinophagaceae bacterium]|nr:MAG: AraC family transcriptional regulator [Chitinophagaceae bacterium]
MVCNRCIMVVKQEFEKAGLRPISVIMGEVELAEPLTGNELRNIGDRLTELGFEVLDSKQHKQIEKIKSLLIEKVQSGEIEEHFSLTEFLSKALNKEYTQLSRLFSEAEGHTIEQFFILQKIEKVKEWLVYDELTLSEIAWKLGYSSVAHLSAQFKKITGLTPSYFKTLGNKNRKSLDQL